MKIKFLHNKKGVTLLEGLIALLLLAVIATGTFGVLLSTSRKSGTPNIREEMTQALLRAKHELDSAMQVPGASNPNNGPCWTSNEDCEGAFDTSCTYDIRCLLPPICDRNKSNFTYRVQQISDVNNRIVDNVSSNDLDKNLPPFTTSNGDKVIQNWRVSFAITCNGFTL